MPAGEPWHKRVEVPEPPGMLVELSVQTKLVEFVATARVTVPVKPLREVREIVEAPVAPAFTLTLVGFAAIEKSGALVT